MRDQEAGDKAGGEGGGGVVVGGGRKGSRGV